MDNLAPDCNGLMHQFVSVLGELERVGGGLFDEIMQPSLSSIERHQMQSCGSGWRASHCTLWTLVQSREWGPSSANTLLNILRNKSRIKPFLSSRAESRMALSTCFFLSAPSSLMMASHRS